MANAIKRHGRVYTPKYLVNQILDFCGYNGSVIIGKHVIDNSCGDGAFLQAIVERYCEQYESNDLKRHLETYIHGIELDEKEWERCIVNLNAVASRYDASNVHWDVLCADALTVNKYDKKMDYVFGNPPYVRVHNLGDSYQAVRNFHFAQQGMTDLFIVFFELCFRMIRPHGKIGIITPSSWLRSQAGKVLREYIVRSNNLSGIIDLQHYQPFDATTYTAIFRFEEVSNQIEVYHYIDSSHAPHHLGNMQLSDIHITGNFYISDKQHLDELRAIRTGKAYHYVTVKNGIATLADKIFIGDHLFTEGTIDILKASTGRWTKCIFPYNAKGQPLPLSAIEQNKTLFDYLCAHREKLEKGRDMENKMMWYLFGRSQAIKDVFRNKYAINTIIRDTQSIHFEKVVVGKGVYSGLYILSDIDELELKELVISNDFVAYVSMLANYKSGGYYTFTSKDIEQYLNYKLTQRYGQSRISQSDLRLF